MDPFAPPSSPTTPTDTSVSVGLLSPAFGAFGMVLLVVAGALAAMECPVRMPVWSPLLALPFGLACAFFAPFNIPGPGRERGGGATGLGNLRRRGGGAVPTGDQLKRPVD